LFEIGIIDKHYIAYKDTNISKYAIENYEKIKSKTNWWLPVKKQKGKNALWVLKGRIFFSEICRSTMHIWQHCIMAVKKISICRRNISCAKIHSRANATSKRCKKMGFG
jgi:hypothetical protein